MRAKFRHLGCLCAALSWSAARCYVRSSIPFSRKLPKVIDTSLWHVFEIVRLYFFLVLRNCELLCSWMCQLLCKESKCELPYDSIGQTAEESMAGENSSHEYANMTQNVTISDSLWIRNDGNLIQIIIWRGFDRWVSIFLHRITKRGRKYLSCCMHLHR